MIDCGEGTIGTTNRSICSTEAFEGLRGGDFVDEVGVDVNETCTIVLLIDDMGIPDFIVDGLRMSHWRGHCNEQRLSLRRTRSWCFRKVRRAYVSPADSLFSWAAIGQSLFVVNSRHSTRGHGETQPRKEILIR